MYTLIEKTNKDEVYKLPYKYNSAIVIHMHYHTTRHYWHVAVYFVYAPHFRTDVIEGNGYVETRKEARKIANSLMQTPPDTLWDKLSEFHKNEIKAHV